MKNVKIYAIRSVFGLGVAVGLFVGSAVAIGLARGFYDMHLHPFISSYLH